MKSRLALVVGVAASMTVACVEPPGAPPEEIPVTAEELPAAPEVVLREEPLVDLLYRTRSHVSVSSRVENDADAPEHLVDRRTETAWNGASGDLDATIDFTVPATVRVKRLQLVVGYDRGTARGDLFTQNHRIKKIAVERRGAVVGVFDLDPADRRPQAIALDEPGGSFSIRVLETQPGSESRFREVVVSELEVLGTAPGEELVPPNAPEVTVGGEEGASAGVFHTLFEGAPYTTPEELCRRHVEISGRQLASAKAGEAVGVHVEEMQPSCSLTAPAPGVSSLPSPWEVRVLHGIEDVAFVDRLVVHTERGWFPTRVVLDSQDPGPGCGATGILRFEGVSMASGTKSPTLQIDYIDRQARWLLAGEPMREVAARYRVACTADGSRVSCRRVVIAATENDVGVRELLQTGGEVPLTPKRWDWTREATVDEGGRLRLGPCVDPRGGHVRCTPTVERMLERF